MRVFDQRGVIASRQHDPLLVMRAEAREKSRLRVRRRKRIALALDEQRRHYYFRRIERLEFV